MRAFKAQDGTVSWAADYEAFGKATVYVPGSRNSPTITLNMRLPGQYFDSETGLHYNGARYYDPNLGAFPQPDPLAARHVTSQPLYAYAMNAPLDVTDPAGQYAELCETATSIDVFVPIYWDLSSRISPIMEDVYKNEIERDWRGSTNGKTLAVQRRGADVVPREEFRACSIGRNFRQRKRTCTRWNQHVDIQCLFKRPCRA